MNNVKIHITIQRSAHAKKIIMECEKIYFSTFLHFFSVEAPQSGDWQRTGGPRLPGLAGSGPGFRPPGLDGPPQVTVRDGPADESLAGVHTALFTNLYHFFDCVTFVKFVKREFIDAQN